MTSLQTGRVCMKVAGREAGGLCVYLKNAGKSFALITGPKILTGVKRRNVNISHLEPTQYMVDLTEDATDEQVITALEKAGLIKKFGLKIPSAAQLKEKEKKQQEKTTSKEIKTEDKSKKEIKKK